MIKILIAAPTSKHKDYCFQKWAYHIKKFTYPDLSYLLVDNTNDSGEYAKQVLSKHFPVIHIDRKPDETQYQIITRSQNIIRDYFLKKGFEFLFICESDIFPPFNVIEYLLQCNKRVCSIPYFIYSSAQTKILQFDYEDFGSERIGSTMNLDKTFINWDGKMKPKKQPGLGCILIHKSVIQKIKFRASDEDDFLTDVYFHYDINQLGIECYVSELYFAEHKNSSWFAYKKE